MSPMIITVPSIFLWVSLCLVQCFAQTPVAVDSIASHNVTRNKKKKTPVDINSITVDSFQCSKRKLILEIGKGGLGNKLWGVRFHCIFNHTFLFPILTPQNLISHIFMCIFLFCPGFIWDHDGAFNGKDIRSGLAR